MARVHCSARRCRRTQTHAQLWVLKQGPIGMSIECQARETAGGQSGNRLGGQGSATPVFGHHRTAWPAGQYGLHELSEAASCLLPRQLNSQETAAPHTWATSGQASVLMGLGAAPRGLKHIYLSNLPGMQPAILLPLSPGLAWPVLAWAGKVKSHQVKPVRAYMRKLGTCFPLSLMGDKRPPSVALACARMSI